jgi:hypothetical protein
VAARLRAFEAVVGWTWHFVPGFLSELALAELVENSQEAGHSVRTKRTWAYYHPASEHLEWTAWAAVVELALRSLVAALARSTSVYMRHLLLRDRTPGLWRPITVELVLVTADEMQDEKLALDAIGVALRDVLRDTDSLFHIGVGVLCHGGSNVRFEGRLRRAFPWLLTATRRWRASPRANSQDAPVQTRGTLRRLTLTNYRLSGVRDITLADARVHLVHGPNGSGKSSIAEALEIVTSGKIERLEEAGEKKYDQVIRNSMSTSPATVRVGWARGNETTLDNARTITADGLEEPLDTAVDPSSFRLDQPLMDRLIRQFPHTRARIFLRAFFPEAVASLSAYEQAAQAHEEALAKLVPVLERLTSARNLLAELQDWRSGAFMHTAEEFHVVLNRWLEQTALLDLLQRERSVRATVQIARAAGWKPFDSAGAAAIAALGDVTEVGTLGQSECEGSAAVDELQAKLASFRPSMSDQSDGDAAKRRVSLPVVEALNAISRFLLTQDELERFGLLGHKVAAVINAADMPTYARIIIGTDKWAEPILNDLDALIAVCNALRADDVTAPAWPGKGSCAEYDEAMQTHATRRAAGRELSVRFIDKLRLDTGATGEFDGSLIAALNEVIALFTPARWAYPDIRLPPNLADGKLGLPMHLGDAESTVCADLHLNTAELNLFTVALFLLCIGRVPKPLNLLVFDDPLQNMDELTSTALARGLAKILRMWADLGRTEEVLLLFHGYNDLDRFRTEIAAATYRLPWLSPSTTPTSIEIKADGPGGDVLAIQSIQGVYPQVTE